MPNWCYSQICFKGKPENIKRLQKDLEAAISYSKEVKYKYVNLYTFFENNGFYPVQYNSSPNVHQSINFRGDIEYVSKELEIDKDNNILVFCTFETAWYMDYNVLHLISLIYNVTFSAYSEEPNMGVYNRCTNDYTIPYYINNEYTISPDYDTFDDYDCYDFFKNDLELTGPADIIERSEDYLKDKNVEYQKYTIYEDEEAPCVYGVYYDL